MILSNIQHMGFKMTQNNKLKIQFLCLYQANWNQPRILHLYKGKNMTGNIVTCSANRLMTNKERKWLSRISIINFWR